MQNVHIGFIGGGNMAHSVIGGLIADGCAPSRITASDPDPGKRETLQNAFGIEVTADNTEAVRSSAVVVLAVKPQVLPDVAQEISATVQSASPLVVSIAAGIREPDLRRWLGGDTAIVRAMPNTPALVSSGATALYANPTVGADQRSVAESIVRAVGLTVWLEEESDMDAVTALSGSGPAYFFLLMEAMETAGAELGLPRQTARLLTLQTAFGAAKMALESAEDAADLRRRVTSPGGTTEKAIEVLQQGGIEELIRRALQAAHARSVELADMFGQK